jgi:hypothetical protein
MKMKKFYSFIFLIMLPFALFSQNWDWARHVTGTNNIATEVVAVDNNDNVIIGGLRRGDIEFVGSTGPVTMTSSTTVNSPFIAKYNPDGSLLWANGLGGTVASNLKSIVTDALGNIYAVGSFQGTDYVFRSQDGNDLLLTSGGAIDPFLLKYDPDGNLLWVKRFATASGNVRTLSVILDNSNNIILSGFFQNGTLDFGGGTSFAFTGSVNNGYLAKFDNDGTLIWAKHFPGTWARLEAGMAICQTEGFYATITIRETVDIEGFGTITATNAAANYELVFVKFNNDGVAQWVRHATNTNDSYGGNFITSDESGNGYFTGRFRGNITFQNPSGDPIVLSSSGGSWDNFLAKYNKDGTLMSAVRWGNGGEEWNFGIDYDDQIITTTGFFTGSLILNPGATADTLVSKGTKDSYIINYTSDLTYLSSTAVGGTTDDEALSVAFDSEGNAVFGGYFTSPTIDFGPTQLTNGGSAQDLFLAKIIDIRVVTSATPVSCFGGSDGGLGFSVSGGGTAPYTYSVFLGVDEIASGTYSTPVSLTGLAAGTYKITVTDANLKSKVKYVQITQPNQLTASINVTNITTCYGALEGIITITGAAGGYGTYEYSINGGTDWQPSNVFNNIGAGTYHVMIRDAAFPACERTLNETVEITQPTEIIIMPMPTNITCNGAADGKIEISVTGGSESYQYSINGGETYFATNIFTGLTDGAYSIYVDDGVCQKFGGIVSIIDPDEITANQILFEPITCFGANDGSITVNQVAGGSGSYEYSINGVDFFESNLFTGLGPNAYDVFIKDTYGCTVQAGTIEIIEPNPISIVTVVPQNITGCFGALEGEITITATGGTGVLSYSINDGTDWQAGSGVFTGLAAGNYIVKVKDENNCETTWASNPVVITQPAEIVIDDVTEENISCFGLTDGTITVTASGGTGTLEYSINGTDYQTSNVFEDLAKDTYEVFVKDENGCIVQWGFDVDITEPTELIISDVIISIETSVGSNDGSITLTVTGGTSPYDFTLTPGDVTNQTGIFQGLNKGTYDVDVIDANGCSIDTTGIYLSITGIDIVKPIESLSIYPNPSTGQFVVEFNNQLNKELFIRIFNVVGQVVYTHKVDPLDTFVKKEINLENEAKGVYMIQITGPDSKLTKKLIIR